MHCIYRGIMGRAQRVFVMTGLMLAGASAVLPSTSVHADVDMGALAPHHVPLPYSFHDSLGMQWDVQADGSIGPGNADVYDAGGRLFVGQNEPYAPNVQSAYFDLTLNELTFPNQQLAGLNVSRRVSMDAKAGACRWVEILENPTGTAIKTRVHVNFDIGAAVQSSQGVNDEKSHKTIGLAVFDGNRGLAMLGGGRGAAVSPTFTPQQGNDQVDVTWDVEVPARKSIALVHLQAIRPTVNDAQAFLEKSSDREVLHDLPPAIAKVVVNFAGRSNQFGDMDLLRGDLLDVIELRGGDQYKGTIQEKTFSLQTPYGAITLPMEKVLAMLAVGEFRPMQLVVTREGEAFGGILQSPAIHLQLSSGQITAVPVGSIRRLGVRRQPNDSDNFKYEHPMLMLRNGDRIAVEMPAAPIPVLTRYGKLLLEPQSLGALIFQEEDQPVHQVLLIDGSRIAALAGQDALELRPLSTGADKPLSFASATVSRLQLVQKIAEPGDDAPVLSLSTGDRLTGTLGGKLLLETAFDTITVNGAEVRGLHHAGSAPTEVQLVLWDDTSLSGRLKGGMLDMLLKSGPALQAPAALVEQYTQPHPLPPPSVLEKLRGLVVDLASDDWKRADRATSELGSMGPHISGALRTLRPQQAKRVQDRIDALLAKFEARSDAPAKPPENAAPGN